MPDKDGKGIMGKSPGDAPRDVRVPSWRGDKGSSDAKAPEETASVHYDR